MHSLTRVHKFGEKLLMLTSLCHSGSKISAGELAGELWTVRHQAIQGSRNCNKLRLPAQSTRFRKYQCSLSRLGWQRSFVSNFVTHILRGQIHDSSDYRGSIPKDEFTVKSFSPDSIESEKTSAGDLPSFRPAPRAQPLLPEELLSEVPFQYWYSYADRPERAQRKKKTKQSKTEEPRRSLIREEEETSELGEQRRSLIREEEEEETSELGEQRRSLMREEVETLTRSRKNIKISGNVRTSTERTTERLSEIVAGNQKLGSVDKGPLTGWKSPRNQEAGVPDGDSSGEQNDDTWTRSSPLTLQEDTEEQQDEDNQTTSSLLSSQENLGGQEEDIWTRSSFKRLEDEVTEKEAFRLSREEIKSLVDTCNRSNRQINIGWRGWGHNYITLVHSYWKKSEVCKIVCKGAVTLDMDFLCNKLEEKTGGRVIKRHGGSVYLYRGRDYHPQFAPKLPVLRQRKKTPAKRLPIPFGLTKDDVNGLRARGKDLPALYKLGRNGVYITLLNDIRKAFEKSDLVRVNCQGLEARNFRALGVKLKNLVPCVLISYEFEHILMWRWDGYKPPSPEEAAIIAEDSFKEDEKDVDHL